jgi:hypothetical protein
MATKVDIAGTESISASQMSEFWRVAALTDSHINKTSLQCFIEGRNPFVFERNEHGHVVITFSGLSLTGLEEIVRLENKKYKISARAQTCFTNTKLDGYDRQHRLLAAKRYKVALMPVSVIPKQSDRMTETLRRHGLQHYGYKTPLAGMLPRLREKISDRQLEELGFHHLAVPHPVISDPSGFQGVLYLRYGDIEFWGEPACGWPEDACFAFFLPGG